MKICFPVESDKGLDSEVFGHFGSAPLFVVFDTQAKSINTINNQDLGHVHGMCNPLKALDGKMVDIIIVGGIGAGAITKLNEMGIKVYKASKGNVQDNIKLFENNTMSEMTLKHTCGGHDGGCGHL
jgi:predicted Fe-Mo cluster-binding NifX family protein